MFKTAAIIAAAAAATAAAARMRISFKNHLSSQSKEGLGRTKVGLGISKTTNQYAKRRPFSGNLQIKFDEVTMDYHKLTTKDRCKDSPVA